MRVLDHLSPTTRRHARALYWRWRYLAVAVCCGLAAAQLAHTLRPSDPATTPVVVTARPVAAGAALTEEDLTVAQWPVSLVLEGAARSTTPLLDRTASVALPAGLPVLNSLVAAGELTADAPAGTVVAPVRLDPEVASLLSPGVRVDLRLAVDEPPWTPAADAGGADTGSDAGRSGGGTDAKAGADESRSVLLAESAVVLPRPKPTVDSATMSEQAIVLIAVQPAEAEQIAARTNGGTVTAVIVRG